MTAEQRAKICKRMLWIIPGLILAIIGDYCMGIEPKGSVRTRVTILSAPSSFQDQCHDPGEVKYQGLIPMQ